MPSTEHLAEDKCEPGLGLCTQCILMLSASLGCKPSVRAFYLCSGNLRMCKAIQRAPL